jgi:hypothetical protein
MTKILLYYRTLPGPGVSAQVSGREHCVDSLGPQLCVYAETWLTMSVEPIEALGELNGNDRESTDEAAYAHFSMTRSSKIIEKCRIRFRFLLL